MTASVSRYPWAIAHAVALVDDLNEFQSLPDSYAQLLRRLIKKVSKDDGQSPIFAHRETLARETSRSVETVYRALRAFERCGWIKEREQRAGEGLRGSESHISFTEKLCDLLDLPYKGKRTPVANDRSTEYQKGKPQPLQEQPLAGHSLEMSRDRTSPPSSNDQREFVKVKGRSVPRDLAWLVSDQDLSVTGLFALMALAKRAQKRLSDIVSVTTDALRRLRARELFAYLRRLCTVDRDFGRDVRLRAKAEMDEIEKDRLLQKRQELQGRWFKSRKTGAIIQVERDGYLRIMTTQGGRLVIRAAPSGLNSDFLDAMERGDIASCAAGTVPE